MKSKASSVLLIVFIFLTIQSQHLKAQSKIVANTSGQYNHNSGKIFMMNEDGSDVQLLKDFITAENPVERIVIHDNRIWGLTVKGGNNNEGTLFNSDLFGENFQILHHFDQFSFDEPSVRYPNGGLIYNNEKLWGTTSNSIFFWDLNTSDFNVFIHLDTTSLDFEIDGISITKSGLWVIGNNSIYFVNQESGQLNEIHTLTDDFLGYLPLPILVEHNGFIYGICESGGEGYKGVIYKIDITTKEYSVILDFENTEEFEPKALIEANGKLWGTVDGNVVLDGYVYGILYSINFDGTGYTRHYSINETELPLTKVEDEIWWVEDSNDEGIESIVFSINTNDLTSDYEFALGSQSGGKIISDMIYHMGKIYAYREGGVSNYGLLFSYEVENPAYTALIDFENEEGRALTGSLLEAENLLWGIGRGGGDFGKGVLFNIDKNTSAYTKIHDFEFTSPSGELVYDDSYIWGFCGGYNEERKSYGQIYRFDLSEKSLEVIYYFLDAAGHTVTPSSIAIIDNKIWGTTSNRGDFGRGAIFSLDIDGSNYTEHHHFNNNSPYYEGGASVDRLIKADNKIWGLSRSGGANGVGVLYNISLDGTGFDKKIDFSEGIAESPSTGLIAIDNAVWGITDYGSTGASMLYKYDFEGNFSVLYNFNKLFIGDAPTNIIVKDGKLIGMTTVNGQFDKGTLFSYDIGLEEMTKLFDVNLGSYREDIIESFLFVEFGDNLNNQPILSSQSFTIDENSASGTVIGQVIATDKDKDELTYAILSGNTNDAFALSVNGELSVATSTELDFETTPSFSLQVEVNDGNGGTAQATITINLNDVDENTAPTISNQTFTIDENAVNATIIGQVEASDADGDNLTFSIISGNTNDAFALSASGELSVATSTELDFETTSSFSLEVEVNDGNGGTAQATITINLNDIDENTAPTISNQTFTIDENAVNATVIGQLEASDADGDELTYSILSGNTNDAFALLARGELSVKTSAALDFETTPSFSLEVEVNDGNGGTAQATITINLNDVDENTDPTISNQTFTIDENAVNATVIGQVEASDADGDELTYSIFSGNTNNAFALSVNGELSVATSTELDFETTPSFSLEVEVNDENGGDAQAIISIDLENVDETRLLPNTYTLSESSPSGTRIGGVGIFEDNTDLFPFFETDQIDQTNEALLKGVELINAGALEFSSENFDLILSADEALDYESFETFEVIVKLCCFTMGEEPNATITVNVTNVNEATSMEDQTFSVDENSVFGTTIGQLEAYDEDGDDLHFSILSGNTNDVFALSIDGKITVQNELSLDYETIPSFELEVEVIDGNGGADTATITIDLVDLEEKDPLGVYSKMGLNFFPNPTNGIVRIKTPQFLNETGILIDFSGKKILEVQLNQGDTTMDLHLLPAGIYLFKVGEQAVKITKIE